MAWWDHEELKGLMDRSDRYFMSFPGEYSVDQRKEKCYEILSENVKIDNKDITLRIKQIMKTYGIKELEIKK